MRVNRLSRHEMIKKTGMDTLGYALPQENQILVRNDLDKETEKMVLGHEFEHIKNGEEGPFWGALAVAAASYLASKNSSDKASSAMESSAKSQAGVQKYMYDTTRADYAPWREAGTQALGEMNQMLYDPNYDFTADPGYQFRLEQGVGARDASAAAGGSLFSGRQLKALTEYGQNLGTQEYQNRFNRLASMAGLGQFGTQGTAAAGSNYAQGMTNAYGNMGQARASGYLGQGNAMSNAINQGMYWYGNQQNQGA